MNPTDFCYWLQGHCELNPCVPSKKQWETIRSKLQEQFCKITEDNIEVEDNKTLYDCDGFSDKKNDDLEDRLLC